MDTKEELKSIIVRLTGCRRDAIVASAELVSDLSLAGEDAAELINSIHERFGTSFETFDFQAYFPDETAAIWSHLGKLIGLSGKERTFTFGHLVTVVENGKWHTP